MSVNHKFDPAVFKAYDIRGIVPEQLNTDFALKLGQAIALLAHKNNVDNIVIGYDGRLSSPELAHALAQGVITGGINVTNIGLVHTPLVYFAAHIGGSGSGVAITGSHNPPNYNGFKMMLAGTTLHGQAIQDIAKIMVDDITPATTPGTITTLDLTDQYIQHICNHVKLVRPIHIAIDCGNGAGAVIASRLFQALGCQVDELYCTVDGNFPNHHPDPADPKNLQDLITHLQNTDCELGLAFDGDADRLGVVTKNGQIIWPDRQMMLFAQDILQNQAGAQIIYDVKCSKYLTDVIKSAGGQPLMSQTGHSLIKARLAETNAPLAGEMSGHIFFNDRWFGFDDGIYAGARLLEILARHDNPSTILESLPQGVSTPELKLPMAEGQAHAFVEKLKQYGNFPKAIEKITMDGIRCEYKNGFGLARASNTTPVVVLRFEGDDENALEVIQSEFRQAIIKLLPDAQLPF